MMLPDKASLGKIVERYAELLALVGTELGQRPLVLPNSDFFPDRFNADEESAAALVERMMDHGGLADIPLTTRVVAEDGPEAPHEGCSSGCAVPGAVEGTVPRLVDDGSAWTLQIPAFELSHPVVLTATVARALGHVFLVESLPSGHSVAPAALFADYASVALGYGPLLLEGAHIYSKGCGGPSVSQVTRASLAELAVTTALFSALGGHAAKRALSVLSVTQKAVFDEALEWVKSNAPLVTGLRVDPNGVAAGNYSLSDSKPWLVRLFGKSKQTAELELLPETFAPRRRAPAQPLDPEQEELRALVEEALAEQPGAAE